MKGNINVLIMKIILLDSILLFGCYVVQATLFEKMRVDENIFDNLRFTLSDTETDFRALPIVFDIRDIADENVKPRFIESFSTSDSIQYAYEEKVFLVTRKLNDHCVIINYTSTIGGQLAATIDTRNMHLYGGAEHVDLKWPYEQMDYDLTPYITSQTLYQAILEPYWLTSTGYFIYVDQRVPLFIELNSEKRVFSLIASERSPYVKPFRNTFLNFTVCKFENARAAHQHAIEHYLGKPSRVPDIRRVKEPIWSTWVRYKDNIDANVVHAYAREIHDHGYGGQLEIDDDWEECYGSLTPNENKFEDLRALVRQIKQLGFRVTIWVHPFVNSNCMPASVENDYFVKNVRGEQQMRWWRGNASYIDFTNPKASLWYRNRLTALLHNYELDSFKFDGGESSFSPAPADFFKGNSFHPETIVHSYVRLIASLGGNVHTRVARGTQKYPIFVTMMDRDSRWDRPLGLSTLIPQLLQLNILGYSFVLPDMIGGNFYGMRASPELFVRWLQANVFMPSMQFSMLPWDFGEQVAYLTKKFVDLHARYADEIIHLMHRNVKYGEPVNPPIWWIAPDDPEALVCDSEYLLGENLLVAPVITEGAVERDIYLPKGTWQDENHFLARRIKGPVWIRQYPANLTVLPYFTRISTEGNSAHHMVIHAPSYHDRENMDTYSLPVLAPILIMMTVIVYVVIIRCSKMRRYVFGVFRRV